MNQKLLKITLPREPVDGYELRYFSIDYDTPQAIRLRYHANASWNDVCDGERKGAPFIDEWQVFENERFVSRMVGWRTPEQTVDHNDFERREDAVAALKQRFLDRAQGYEKQAERERQKITDLEHEEKGAPESALAAK